MTPREHLLNKLQVGIHFNLGVRYFETLIDSCKGKFWYYVDKNIDFIS
jgi:hypothetical protein